MQRTPDDTTDISIADRCERREVAARDGGGPQPPRVVTFPDPAVPPRARDLWIRSQRVTALLVTVDRLDPIEEAIDSVLGQSCPPQEVLVVDDLPHDGMSARLARYGGRVRCIGPHNGDSSAFARALREATGDWLWLFETARAALPNGVRHLLQAAADRRTVAMAFDDPADRKSAAGGESMQARPLLLRALKAMPLQAPTALVRRHHAGALGADAERSPTGFLLRLLMEFEGERVEAAVFARRDDDRADRALRAQGTRERAAAFGREVRRGLPLSAYLARSAPAGRTLPDLRRALLQRMAVMASKGLVRETLVDLRSAANLAMEMDSSTLDAGEALACREVGRFPLFRAQLLDAPGRVVGRLRSAAANPGGRAIVARVARGIVDAARHDELRRAERVLLLRCAAALFRACGPLHGAAAYLPTSARP
jgi:hypothetical protein